MFRKLVKFLKRRRAYSARMITNEIDKNSFWGYTISSYFNN